MNRSMKALAVLVLQTLVCLTVRAEEQLPTWAMKVFNQRLSAQYELAQSMKPSFYTGDFNGDGKSDVALLIKEKATGKLGIAILDSSANQPKILGAGKPFGNGSHDFSWMDNWSLQHSAKVDRLYVAKSEAASAVIYWDGSKYKWQQAGD